MEASDTAVSERMSDAAIQAKTGKAWAEWFALLDAAGAVDMPHPQIARHLYDHHEISGWWAQSVTVAYEQARGLRKPHQTVDGFQVSASKTLAVPVSAVYHAWADAAVREQWLGTLPLTIRKGTPDKSLRITWGDGKTSVDVNLYARGEAKSQMQVQHSKLPNADEAARMKAFWAERVGRLQQVLEG